jgi:dephospho-CoA kinase
VIGLTGGSGSGKSAAAEILRAFGAVILDADQLSREATADAAVLRGLEAAFGREIFDENGRLNRQYVSDRAFSEKDFLERLTEITHAYIIKEIYARIADSRARAPGRVIVLDAPVPVKKGFLDVADAVWVMTADYDTRMARIMARDHLSAERAAARIRAQLSDAAYAQMADVSVENNGGAAELEKKLRRCWREFRAVHSLP